MIWNGKLRFSVFQMGNIVPWTGRLCCGADKRVKWTTNSKGHIKSSGFDNPYWGSKVSNLTLEFLTRKCVAEGTNH